MDTPSKIFKPFIKALLAISLALSASVSNGSEVLFQQTVVEPINGFQSDASFFNGDDFSVANPVNLESISWWGAYIDPNSGSVIPSPDPSEDQFSVKIFNTLSDTPNNVLDLNGTLSRSVTGSNSDYYLYQLTLNTSLSLGASSHFLSIQNQTSTVNWQWLWGTPGNGTTILYENPQPSWTEDSSYDADMAFRLEGIRIQTVPEPNILILLLLGSGMICLANKKMKKAFPA